MAKPTGKKRGRPRMPLADVQPIWEGRLRRAGNPNEISSDFEISEQSLPWTDREPSGRKIRPTKVMLGESSKHESVTMPRDSWYALLLKDDDVDALSASWLHYLEYMYVIAEARSPKDKGMELKKLFLEDARSRSKEEPPPIPAQLGTSADFRADLAGNELEIRFESNHNKHVVSILVLPIPPNTEDDLDEGEEPKGHWEGLKWFPDDPQ